MQKILLIGNGARENAIAESVVKFGYELYSFMSAKNPGIVKLCREYKIGNILDAESAVNFAKGLNADAVIIGPEAPLEAGVSDKILENEIPCISPTKSLARLETSKEFARNLMKEYHINAYPEFEIFKSDEIKNMFKFIDDLQDVAVKPIGLTGGKGVKVTGKQLNNAEEAKAYAGEILKKDNVVLIEEKLEGEEFTLQAFCDGENLAPCPLVQDHKSAYENDIGPNTGGMGSYSDKNLMLPFVTRADYDHAIENLKKVINVLKKDYGKYIGILYGQFIATKDGVQIIEFNARFGDPEAINVLPLIKDNWIEKILDKKLSSGLKFENNATVCKYLVPTGYPENPVKTEIYLDESKFGNNSKIYYANVYEENGKIFGTDSRAIALLGIGKTIEEAEKIAENSTKFVKGNLYHRKDIGTKELINKRLEHIKRIRNI
ncbi:Phosphoribosylamine--glycine ligase [groundwater metagenome]|uniref:phosphoribosylamine--glycine ligase n=1 Tax=groundwater metagenome TaxID=717931 RepID=A0A098EAQ1_9ZZZZ